MGETETEIKIKSSELNTLLLKFMVVLTGALVGILTWLGSGMYSAQQKTAEATVVLGVRLTSMEQRLHDAPDRHEFDLELSTVKTRISSTEARQAAIEVRQTALDLELQKMRRP